MAIDKKLIQQVKQACARIKKAGISLGMEKLAGPFRNQPILPRRRAAPQQQYQAPAPQQVAPQQPLGENAGPLPSYEGNQASSDAWKQAPAGMQRFRNSATGEVFYAPNGQVANQYTAGGDASALGIRPGERAGSQEPSAAQTVAEQASARDQEMFSGPAAGTDSPVVPEEHPMSGMDAAIEESKKIRAADPRNQVRAPAAAPATPSAPAAPAGKPYDRGIPFRQPPQFKSLSEGTVPLSTGSVGPSFGSETDPFSINPRNMASNAVNNVVNAAGNFGVGVQNAAGNAYDAAAFTAGNAADQGKRVMLDAINSPVAKAVGTATGGMGPGGYSYNRNAPGRAPAPPAPPPAIPNTMTAD